MRVQEGEHGQNPALNLPGLRQGQRGTVRAGELDGVVLAQGRRQGKPRSVRIERFSERARVRDCDK
jgi:hypothetical protein